MLNSTHLEQFSGSRVQIPLIKGIATQWLTICWENRTTVTGADPSGKASRIIRSAAPLPYRFGGSEPNGEIKIIDAETIKR
jgi:hypothetical protein